MMEKLLERAITVGEIIEALQKLDPKMKVIAKGCDCINPVSKIYTFHTNGQMWASIEVDTRVGCDG